MPQELSGSYTNDTATVTAPSGENSVTGKTNEKIRLDYLDGIRGLCALYVVIYHSDIAFGIVGELPSLIKYILIFLGFGHYAVAFFIVLSGYCLMLPVARSRDGLLRGGTYEYLKRRALRILPPYYAALVMSLLIDSLPIFQNKVGLSADVMFPAFDPKNILAHVLLVHNLNPEYNIRIDPPMWSVAPEWQIYFLFPLVLLPVWRRFGIAAAVLAAFFLGYLPHFLFAENANFDWTYPWYIGLFATGMAASVINFSTEPRLARLRSRTLLILMPLVFLPLLVFIVLTKHEWHDRHVWLTDTLAGFSAGAIITYCTREIIRGGRPLLARFLELRVVQWLGLISYSLYLTHFPVISLLNQLLYPFHPAALVRCAIEVFVFVPFCVFFAYLFHRVFERPFMPSHGRDVRAVRK